MFLIELNKVAGVGAVEVGPELAEVVALERELLGRKIVERGLFLLLLTDLLAKVLRAWRPDCFADTVQGPRNLGPRLKTGSLNDTWLVLKLGVTLVIIL